jgi:chain length determinant protein EpsF
MTATQFFSILRARWWLALAVLAVVLAATVALSLVWPKKYAATASVVVDAKPDPVSAMLYPGMSPPSFMATQVDILQSDRVAQRVVRNLKLADNPEVRAQWQQATGGQGLVEAWLADSLVRSLEVKPSRESTVLTVTYKAGDPRFAATMANAFVQAYIDTSLDMRTGPAKQYSSFFDGRAKEAREQLEASQGKLSAFQKANGIIATDERLDVENSRLNELSSQLVTMQAISSESSSRNTQAQGASGDKIQDVLSNPVIASLKNDLSRAEVGLQMLNTRYGENHPQVIETKGNIAELRARLEAETRKVTGGVSVSATINRQREAQVRAELESQRAKVLRMKAVRDEGSVLARDVDNAQRTYDALQTRLTQTNLEGQANQTNINLLSQATPPVDPASPRLGLNVLLAVFGGTLAGVLAALALEMADRRVRSTTDVAELLGVPVLGVLPNANLTGLSAKRRSSLLQQRVIGRLAGPVIKTPE